MLTPEQLQEIVETMYPLLDGLNAWIVRDMVERFMARAGRGEKLLMTGSDEWQMYVLQSAGGHLETVQKEIRKFIDISDVEIARIFEDAGIRALAEDNKVYTRAGGRPLALSRRMVDILEDTYHRTNGTIHNLTRTTANESQKEFIRLLDEAHMRVITGAESYGEAVSDTVNRLADTQLHVQYPTGHVDTIEVAVLRAVRTGVAQATGNMTIQGMKDREWDLIRVSAHLGARYGDGGQNPGNHFWWQGKLYSRSGKSKEYPPFEKTTGYGTGEGLSGWNCRHSFGPGDPDFNPFEDFDKEENKKIYDLSQKQRRMERNIRATHRKLIGQREAIDNCTDPAAKAALEAEYANTSRLLERQNNAYKDFCEENELRPLPDRIQAAKWSHEDARRSVVASRESMVAIAKRNGTIKKVQASDLKNGLPRQGEPNSVVDKMEGEKVVQRRVYDSEGLARIDYDTTNHNDPKGHPTGAHKHIFDYRKKNPHGKPLPLTDEELEDNSDIIQRGVNYHDEE